MSKRAEEKAIEYADKKLQRADPELWETGYSRYRKMSVKVMDGSDVEEAYQEGYEQAEKDLALTRKDIKFIIQTFHIIVSDAENITSDEAYEETLKRFNEQRKK